MDINDQPLIKRMKAIQMRGLFLSSQEIQKKKLAGDVQHLFLLEDDGFKDRLNVAARMAHMHQFIEAYGRYHADGKSFGPEPACVQELVDQIIQTSDPRVTKTLEFIEGRIDFAPVRTQAFFGKKFFAWITQKDIVDTFLRWYAGKGQDAKSDWKEVIKVTMKCKGRAVVQMRPTNPDGSVGKVNAYNNCSWLS